jgi:hypothetical protein
MVTVTCFFDDKQPLSGLALTDRLLRGAIMSGAERTEIAFDVWDGAPPDQDTGGPPRGRGVGSYELAHQLTVSAMMAPFCISYRHMAQWSTRQRESSDPFNRFRQREPGSGRQTVPS